MENKEQVIVIAVCGNPNSGKSTLINAIAGTRLHVGNWPGVTVEKKEASLDFKGRTIRLVDLPGTYSLTPYSQEEIVARDFLIKERPDAIINVVDATNLERNLCLTIQLMELEIPVVMALNIYDEAQKKGFTIDTSGIEKLLNIKVVPTIAKKGKGVIELLEAAVMAGESKDKPRHLSYDKDIEDAYSKMWAKMQISCPEVCSKYPSAWTVYKLMEGDRLALPDFDAIAGGDIVSDSLRHIKKAHSKNMESILNDARYAQAMGLTREVLDKPDLLKLEITERIDKIVLNRYLGIPIFLIFMWLMFKVTFDFSAPYTEWIDATVSGPLTRLAQFLLTLAGTPSWLTSLCTDGVLAGTGIVFSFVPMIFTMMFFITFLEGSGYMARAAFVMDQLMHKIGLHGKSFIPMLLGFGCNVPAIYATRTLENPSDKALTALLIPLMSCSARLPVYMLFVGVFFREHSGTVLWSLYVLGIVLAIAAGLVFRKTIFKGDSPTFIMELPPYRMPSFSNLMIHSWEKGKHFLVRAGTYILAMSILVWFLFNLPLGVEKKEDSLLGIAGKSIVVVFEPLGFGNWQAVSALITGVIAKEIVVTTMGEIYDTQPGDSAADSGTYSFTDDLRSTVISFFKTVVNSVVNVFTTLNISSISVDEAPEANSLKSEIKEAFTPLSAYSFMVFVLLYMPCLVTAVAFKNEFGTWKWFTLAVLYSVILAWTSSFLIYQLGKLLKIGV